MTNLEDANQICPGCGTNNPLSATRCISCGIKLQSDVPAAFEAGESLKHVDVATRVDIATYETDYEAELACGLLRSSGIACELSTQMIPGLPADLTLYVNAQDEETARRILEDVEQNAPPENDESR
jgi:hypothetical protein